MVFLAIAVAAMLVTAVWFATGSIRVASITCLIVGALMTAQFAIASTGILREWERRPPPLLLLIVATLAVTLLFAFSRLGGAVAARLSFAALIGSQIFRLPLELTMRRAASEGVMPVQMSYSGFNFDILTGISAAVVCYLLATGKASRRAAAIWNIFGFCLLTNIVAIAVASLPLFKAFGEDRLNVWVTYPPFVWLPGVLVPFALLGHALIWRKLRFTKKTSSTP